MSSEIAPKQLPALGHEEYMYPVPLHVYVTGFTSLTDNLFLCKFPSLSDSSLSIKAMT